MGMLFQYVHIQNARTGDALNILVSIADLGLTPEPEGAKCFHYPLVSRQKSVSSDSTFIVLSFFRSWAGKEEKESKPAVGQRRGDTGVKGSPSQSVDQLVAGAWLRAGLCLLASAS